MNKQKLGTALCGLVLLGVVSGCGSTSSTAPFVPVFVTPATQALWVANGTNVVEFTSNQFAGGVLNVAPALTLNSAAFGAPQGVQFDSQGDLWVIDGGNGSTVPTSLFEFSPAQLSALGTNPSPTPIVTITASASFGFLQQGVFDHSGNFWVSDNANGAVFVISPALLAASSNLTPPVSGFTSNQFSGPLGLAFDGSGNLWVANNASTTIVEFNQNTLPTTSFVNGMVPNVVLSDNGAGSIQGPWALVFDAGGNLWSSNANNPNTIVEFDHANLAVSGSPAPGVTISPATDGGQTTLTAPNGIAFDLTGDLASVSSAAPFGVSLFNSLQLTTGALVPADFFVGNATTLNLPAGCTFGPAH